MKRIIIFFGLCCLVLAAKVAFAGDTGTYKIADYKVKLTPKSDGKVEIEYYQKWEVTGGHIPWITVGLPNDNFEIVKDKSKGAIKSIKVDSSGSWSGVRIDLDKDYKPGQLFEVWFAVSQRRLFYADKDNYKLDFTPGWYDNAETGHLSIEVFFFAKLETIKADPKADKTEGQSLIWERTNLGKGRKFNISVSFPKKLFPKELFKDELKSEGMSGWVIVLIVILVIGVIIFLIWVISQTDGGGYGGGGGIFSGGGYGGGRGGISSGGGGGFGGRSSSCACACVSCACACACAGGGGAGCDRKLSHRCPLCRRCSKQDCPARKGA